MFASYHLPPNTMGSDPMVKKFFSHYAPGPLPQMPGMKQIKRSVCNHIRHFSLLSYLPPAGNPSTQPPIRRLALPLIRSITIFPPTTPHTPNSLFSAARTHRPTNTPHTSAYSDRPYVALMFRKRSINHCFVCRNRLDDAEDLVVAS